ncbi:MAG: nitroreductase [Clostridiales bacterium]|nr:nitroreductase [Clostridiales bacterium]
MKKEALEVLENRRSIRKFKAEQIKDSELEAVLKAGTYAPTGMGTQSPVIVAVQKPETVAKIDKMNAEILNMPAMPHPYYGAPTILIVLAPKGGLTYMEDGSLAAGNLMNAAYAVGLGSCWIHRDKEMFESEEGKALLKEWGLPDNLAGVASIALGYPDCPQPKAAKRKDGYVVYVK